jgi:hypothetical protein
MRTSTKKTVRSWTRVTTLSEWDCCIDTYVMRTETETGKIERVD